MPAVPPESLIVVTGITGYVGSHVGLAALKAGHRVRGTVRSLQRAEDLKVGYEKFGIPKEDLDKRLEIVVVNDLSSEEQYLDALQGADGVAHVALSLTNFFNPRIINDAVGETLSLLQAARKVSSVQRVVLTSSSAAVAVPPMHSADPLTDQHWNEDAIRIVENKEPMDQDPLIQRASHFLCYGAAKAKAEKAAWKFVEVGKPQFDLVSIIPDTTFGPIIHGEAHSSAKKIVSFLNNDLSPTREMPPHWHVDVRDSAKLHLLGLTTPSMGGRRFWAVAAPYGWNLIFSILRKHFPNAHIPHDLEDNSLNTQKIDNRPATQLLGEWIGLEQSIVDLGKSLGY